MNVEARDEDGNTALGLCVALGHAEGVRVLVEGGASVSGGDNGELNTSLLFWFGLRLAVFISGLEL